SWEKRINHKGTKDTKKREKTELNPIVLLSSSCPLCLCGYVLRTSHDRRTRPDPRLRLAVRAADRPAGARAERLLHGGPARRHRRPGAGAAAEGADLLRRPGPRVRTRRPDVR